jgi:hypothetical protein
MFMLVCAALLPTLRAVVLRDDLMLHNPDAVIDFFVVSTALNADARGTDRSKTVAAGVHFIFIDPALVAGAGAGLASLLSHFYELER